MPLLFASQPSHLVPPSLIGRPVSYRVAGRVAFRGYLEYVRDGWVGIWQPHGHGPGLPRLDEAPAHLTYLEGAALVTLDPH